MGESSYSYYSSEIKEELITYMVDKNPNLLNKKVLNKITEHKITHLTLMAIKIMIEKSSELINANLCKVVLKKILFSILLLIIVLLFALFLYEKKSIPEYAYKSPYFYNDGQFDKNFYFIDDGLKAKRAHVYGAYLFLRSNFDSLFTLPARSVYI